MKTIRTEILGGKNNSEALFIFILMRLQKNVNWKNPYILWEIS